jgi:putative hemolysin
MAQKIALELLLILVLILANSLFAMSEIAVVSSRKTRLEQMARAGSRRAAAALRLATNPDRFLSTVQIGITMIGVFAGAFGGATIADQIDEYLETIPALVPYSEAIGVGFVVLFITYFSLVLGELVPKRLALDAPERIATMIALPMNALSRIGAPAVHLLTLSTRAVLWLLRIRPAKEPLQVEEEMRVLLRQGMLEGSVVREEQQIVERVFQLDERSVRSVMTPRVDLQWLDLDLPFDELKRIAAETTWHRLPVAAGRIDDIKGIAVAKDLCTGAITTTAQLTATLRAPLFVPETASALELLAKFRETGNHVAVVLNEFGEVEGIVTPTDMLEALVGALPVMGEKGESLAVDLGNGAWSVDAAIDVPDVELLLEIPPLPEQKSDYQTLAGYLIGRLGHMPRVGEYTVIEDYRFEVLDMDGRRIKRILIRKDSSLD